MKVNSISTVFDFMRYCKMPLWFQRPIKDMKVGDIFILGKYTHPIKHSRDSFYVAPPNDREVCFVAEAWIEKKRGEYSFYATWTLPTKITRPHIMTSGTFNVGKKGAITFAGKNDALISFSLVCRYLAKILNCMSIKDKKVYFSANSIPLFCGLWLDEDLLEKRERAKEIDGKIRPIRVCYKDYFSQEA